MSPAAIGRIEPFFFFKASKLAPPSQRVNSGGALPNNKQLTILVVDATALAEDPEAGPCNAACKCEARSPDGPGPEDFENRLQHS